MPRAVIVGGGPAGATAAIKLASAGREVTLIERNATAADKVCGDFLSTEAVAMLEALGVDLSTASTITSLRLVHRRQVAVTRLPFVACGIMRRTLDEALLRQAAASGAVVLRGHRIGALAPARSGLRLNSATIGEVTADTVFLATGKHELRGLARGDRGAGLVGLKMYYALTAVQTEMLRHHVELMLFPEGYAGLQLVEADRAVLCVLLPAVRLRQVAGRWDRLLDLMMDECPLLRDRLLGAQALLERPLAIAGLPYGFVHTPRRNDPSGLFRLGDQAAVIPSLTGDGIALALASGSLAARISLGGGDGYHYHQSLAAGLSRQMHTAAAIHRLCLTPMLQPWLAAACRVWPGAMRWSAIITRARRLTQIAHAA